MAVLGAALRRTRARSWATNPQRWRLLTTFVPIVDPATLDLRLSLAASTDKLDLSDCGLESVPPGVFDLPNLELLALNGNRLTELPPAIARLTNLRRLVVAGNRLRTLPAEIGRLQRLEELFAHGNALESLPETLGSLRQLRQLCVSGNRLTALPESLGDLERLTDFTAGGNRLERIPDSIGRLQALVFLHLHGNRLSDLPDSIGGCGSLQELYVQGNRLTSLPASLAQLRYLNELSVADNALDEFLPDWAGLDALGLAYLYGNRVRRLPPSLARLPALRSLWLEGNPLDPEPLGALLPQLRHVPAVGVDVEAAGGADRVPQCPNVHVGPTYSDGGRVPGYFKLQLHTPGRRAAVLVVAFGSAPGVPNWGKLLLAAKEAMDADPETGVPFDVLFVADPFRQWYGAGLPPGATEPLPSEEYRRRVRAAGAAYPRVVLLGDSMGATGCLLCAESASAALAFCPQVDFETASLRPAYDAARFRAMRADIVEGARRCLGRITIHTGQWQHDEAQARLVAHLPAVDVVVHDVEDHRVALALHRHGRLLPLVRDCIAPRPSA